MDRKRDLGSPIILSLETAMLGGSVFLGSEKQQLAARIGDSKISHSNSLLIDIREALEEASLKLNDVDLFACAAGPGSFTGLRIGIATLKALAATLDRSCVGVPTLQAVAHAAGSSDATVALLPAGRGEIFAQMFRVSKDLVVTELDNAAHLSPQNLLNKYGEVADLVWAGEGAHLQKEVLRNFAREHGRDFGDSSGIERGWKLAPKPQNLARNVALLALQKYERNELESAHALKAIYVRPSDAELNQRCQ
ncbi:MAG TPA: tRNA (adenosine(37)-N6)-threonylcarbamoyltransferase complex dimerization subunit type 1 TsaB [Pyrinomonadaceae bacterium]|nr:tRNA (adenosine(37)-N6)-threonylcarbamoyltransferase complex dimerization subunit type 1 TsaB [Pyrinomonadaceae bacterium]